MKQKVHGGVGLKNLVWYLFSYFAFVILPAVLYPLSSWVETLVVSSLYTVSSCQWIPVPTVLAQASRLNPTEGATLLHCSQVLLPLSSHQPFRGICHCFKEFTHF